MWTEKDGLFQFLRDIVHPYHIEVHVAKGYSSTTVDKRAADRIGTGKGWTLLYVGDHDPTGLDIERKLQDELRFYGSRPQIERVALTLQQAQTLPPSATSEQVKQGDSRGLAYIKNYGNRAWEVESLPVHELRDAIRQAIADNGYDFEAMKQAQALEKAANERIEKTLKKALHDEFNALNESALKTGLADLEMP